MVVILTPIVSMVVGIPGSTLPEIESSPLKIGRDPNRKGLYSNHPFLGAMLVSGRVETSFGEFHVKLQWCIIWGSYTHVLDIRHKPVGFSPKQVLPGDCFSPMHSWYMWV